MSKTANWEEMSDDELLYLHSLGTLPAEAERAIGEQQLLLVVAWDGASGPRPPLRPEPSKAAGPDYESMTNEDLRAILAGRGLEVMGKKEKLVARLQESDAGTEDDEDDEAQGGSPEDDTSNKGEGMPKSEDKPKKLKD